MSDEQQQRLTDIREVMKEITLGRLEMKPGEVLIVNVPEPWGPEQAYEIQELMHASLLSQGVECPVIGLSGGVTLTVAAPAEGFVDQIVRLVQERLIQATAQRMVGFPFGGVHDVQSFVNRQRENYNALHRPEGAPEDLASGGIVTPDTYSFGDDTEPEIIPLAQSWQSCAHQLEPYPTQPTFVGEEHRGVRYSVRCSGCRAVWTVYLPSDQESVEAVLEAANAEISVGLRPNGVR